MKITKKSITLLLAGLLCASNSFSQTYPKQDGVIRLLTYNTHYCKGGTDPGSLNDLNTKRFANILKALDADVVALQELDSAANGRWKRVLLDDIAKWSELDYVQVYGIAADYDGGSVGNGTLVKRWLPIKKIKKMKLSSDVGRILIRTDFEDFSFMSTHLDLDDKHRMNEAAAICTELDYIRKPVFLAGVSSDFGEIGIRIFFGPDVVQEIGGHERGIGSCKTSPEHHVVSIGIAVLPTDSLDRKSTRLNSSHT